MVGAVSTLYGDPSYWISALVLVAVLAILKPLLDALERWQRRRSAARFIATGQAQAAADFNREWEPRLAAIYAEHEAEQAAKKQA